MIREMIAALVFLTRFPIAGEMQFTAKEIGASARWFPLVGLGIGLTYVATVALIGAALPPIIVGFLIVLVEAVITGALHMDGLADMADGFGGGHTREDVLRIMREHAIGVYGAIALILLVGLKATSVAYLLETSAARTYLFLSPVIGRWSVVMMSILQPYARHSAAAGSISEYVGRKELLIASVVTGIPAGYLLQWHSIPLAAAAIGITFAVSKYCEGRIGGITGDTLGANTQIIETTILLMGVAHFR